MHSDRVETFQGRSMLIVLIVVLALVNFGLVYLAVSDPFAHASPPQGYGIQPLEQVASMTGKAGLASMQAN